MAESGPVWPLMRWLWSNSELIGLQKCHRVRYGPNVEVYVDAGGGVWFGGFCRCHSVWACPMCAPVIRAGRAKEMAGGLRALLQVGGGCVFSTYTVPHDEGMPLRQTFDVVSECWNKVRNNRAVRAIRSELQLEFSRSTEVTVGRNGWHPHLHVGEVCWRALSRDEVLDYREVLFSAWCSAVEGVGYRRPNEHGLSVVRADAGMPEYVSKVEGLASELFRMDLKSSKTEAPFAVLRRAVLGDGQAKRLWGEYERTTKARKMLGQSKGFKDLCMYVEASEAELVDPEEYCGLRWVGTLRPEGASLLVLHPSGFEGFSEMVGPGTPEAWRAANAWLTGTAPWFLSTAGWEAAALEMVAGEVWLPESEAVELDF